MFDGKLSGALALLALAGCTPVEDENPDAQSEDTAPSAAPAEEAVPEVFAATAWRTIAEDGSRYTTHFDADGSYRDLRNGDPWQVGEWTYVRDTDGAQLCFLPDAENGIRRCWRPGRLTGDTMEATSDSGKRIELERVDYDPPSDESAKTE